MPPTLPLPAAPADAPRPPSSLFAPPPARRRATGKVLAAAGAVVVLVGGLAVHAAAGPSGPVGFRTAVVGTSNVDQTLEGVGTVAPVTQAAVGFPVAGKVASVGVAVGDGVTVGQTLATLDGASLQMAIDAQQAAVAQAELVLAKARDGVSSGTGSSGTGSASAGPSSGAGGGGATSGAGTASTSSRGSGSSGAAATGGTSGSSSSARSSQDGSIAQAQQDVLTSQQTVDAHLQSAQQALESARRICAAAGNPASSTAAAPTSTSTTVPGDAPGGSSSGTSAGAGASDPAAIVACQTALQGVLDAQHQVNDAQTTLGSAASTYDQLLDQRAAALASSSSSSSGSGQATGSGGGSVGGATVTSADLIKDQSAVDAAAAQLAVAQQALKQATIVSPIAGTVASVGLAVGDAVTAGSSTATVVVVGTGGVEVTTTVSVDRLPAVALGQAATVRPDSGGSAITGKVVAIGAPATSSSGATTYPISVSLPADTTGLRNGSVASVSIVTKAASHALVVPTSAVRTAGTAHTVNVISGTTTKAVPVQVGAIGATWTEITSGLQAGQKVVLADLQAPLPTSATQATNTGRTGTNGAGVRIPGGVIVGGGTGRRNATGG